jgi:hypothetical protein
MRRALWAAVLLAAALATACAPDPGPVTTGAIGAIGAPAAGTAAGASVEPSADAQFAPLELVGELTATRDIVQRYVIDAQAGDRAAMLEAYLPETRRSAETVVIRDLELARPGGQFAGGIRTYSSVFRKGGGLMPYRAGSLVHVEDAERLDELSSAHDGALIVLLEFTDGTTRPVFLVREGDRWWLLP